MTRTARIALTVLASVLSFALASPSTAEEVPVRWGGPSVASVQAPVTTRCDKPAPSTAAGYARLWETLPADQWGAADVSISVPLRDGRVLWLYGDTFSAGRFVHSSAIVQDGGCLHVSKGGAQVLANDRADHIYWIHDARQRSDGLVAIRARLINLTGQGVWAFEDGGAWRTTLVRVSAAGDVVPVQRGPLVKGAAPDPGPMYRLDDNPRHFGYARESHPWAKLTSGKTLTTTCQNWDDGVLHPMAEYRPIWSERRP